MYMKLLWAGFVGKRRLGNEYSLLPFFIYVFHSAIAAYNLLGFKKDAKN